MKLTWEKQKVTTPSQIESHNHMVETLWRWRHAGLVVETEKGEELPELIDTPKRVIRCKCGNEDLSEFTLISLSDTGLYSLNKYGADGSVISEFAENSTMRPELAARFGLARRYTDKDGDERWAWLWVLTCDKCRETTDLWSNELDEFIEFY